MKVAISTRTSYIAIIVTFFTLTPAAALFIMVGVSDHIVLPAVVVVGLFMPYLLGRYIDRKSRK
jgi:hypothetical protein